MAKLITRTRARRKLPPCFFCKQKKNPSHLRMNELALYLTPRGKILARKRSGICARHQRRLGRAIKRARILALV